MSFLTDRTYELLLESGEIEVYQFVRPIWYQDALKTGYLELCTCGMVRNRPLPACG